MPAHHDTVDAYIAGFPAETQRILQQMRDTLHNAAPGSTERISYGIPTLVFEGKSLLHFAGYARHVACYPCTAGIQGAIGDALTPHRTGKATLRFELNEPFPADLLARIGEARANEIRASRSPL